MSHLKSWFTSFGLGKKIVGKSMMNGESQIWFLTGSALRGNG